ncbi:MAG: methyltransferase, CheR-type, SAM-binding domain, C-terminal [Labilithrix sp.]|nr:methyltransferase, CheR-type, SAM-binding domain, C-terminal [Labilithrix sp.]
MTTKRSGSYARLESLPGTGEGDSPSHAAALRPDAAYVGVSALERIEIELLLQGVYRHYGHDFRQYAFSSLRRRLMKRLEGEGLANFSELQARVLHDPEAMDRLVRDMSVNVTGMFRDPSFFLALRERVVPVLRTYPFVRIWHAGCASGEEAYALAIMLEEEGLYDRSRIYATDMNADALERAKSGEFPLARMREYTSNYLQAGGARAFSEYYSAAGDFAAFDPRLKRNVLFAQHNLATDSAFSEFNLILCRNVLIYFDRELKTRVLGLFNESLAPFGLLALGRRESLRFTAVEHDYDEFDARERIYRRRR